MGLFAGRGGFSSSVEIGQILLESKFATSAILIANSYQDTESWFVTWKIPLADDSIRFNRQVAKSSE